PPPPPPYTPLSRSRPGPPGRGRLGPPGRDQAAPPPPGQGHSHPPLLRPGTGQHAPVQGFCLAEVLDADAEAAQPWIAPEYAEGPTLEEAVRTRGPRTGGDLQRLAMHTITALSAIHAAGVVHRDLKPANILLGPDGPRVIDFGIARALDADTSSATRIGTLGHMAPEQLEG